MLRLTLVWLFCFVCIASYDNSSQARVHGGMATGGAVSCPQITDNGCAASPGGSFQVANFFTGYTGTSYAARPTFNAPCVDYKCGVPATANGAICGMNALQDPATATTGGNDNPGCGILPQHCAYSITVVSAQLSVPLVTCSGTSNDITLKGFEFGPVGGHAATYWQFDGTTSGNDTIEYNDMVGDNSVYYQNAFANIAPGTTGNVSIISNNMFGKWVTSFSAQGTGSCAIVATAMTCTGDSGFAKGQYIQGVGISANTAITTVNGGGSYTLNQSNSVSSEVVTSQFQMAGGINISTPGAVLFKYNAATQINGRIATAQQRVGGNTATTAGDITQQYNYFEAGIYSNAEVAHYENVEYTLADAGAAMTWTNAVYQGNVIFQPSQVQAGTTTSSFFLSPGGVSAPVAGTFFVTYTNTTLDKNVAITQGGQGVLSAWQGALLTNYTVTSNWISIARGGSYNSCGGNPNSIGTQTPGPVAFFVGSDDGAGHLTVTNYQGGAAIAFNSTMYVAESHGLITGQTSGTPGGNGVYTVTGDISAGSQNMRSALPAITNAPTISGNMDIDTNSVITASNIISRELSSNPCVYPGMQ